jgi:hypothetical protein
MRLRIINRFDERLKGLPERWAKQYPDDRYDESWIRWGWKPAAQIRPALLALGPHERTKERIDEIMGKSNNSWTEMNCSCCGRDFDTLIRFGDEPDYEAQWQDLCADCMKAGIEALAPGVLSKP